MEETANRQFVELERTHFWFVGRRRIFFALLDTVMDGRRDANVLDVGCGAGGMLDPLSRYGQVSGLDTSADLVDFCHQRGFDRVALGSAYELPVASDSVDLITMFDTIEHIPDDARALREAARALAPGGLLFVSTPAYQFLYANNDHIAHHERRYTARRLRRVLAGSELEVIKITYFNTFLFPVILPVVLAKKLYERLSPPADSTNLSHRIPVLLNRALAAVMGSERHVLQRASFPFGHSIIAIARARSRAPAG